MDININNLPANSFVVRNEDGTIKYIWVPEAYKGGVTWVKYIPE